MRLRAGITQAELGRRSGVSPITISEIELAKRKPRDLTRTRLIKALSAMSPESEKEDDQARPDFFDDVLDRDDFFRKLRLKMSKSFNVLFDQSSIVKLIEAAEFFSRQKYYPGDFATAMEILGSLLRAENRLSKIWDGDEFGKKYGPYQRRKQLVRHRICRGQREDG